MIENSFMSIEFAALILVVAAMAVLARKTGQPPLIAYIVTGLLVGPVFLNFVATNELTSLISELGLGLLLFLVGIEMKLDEIRDILKPIVKIAVGQTILQTALAFVVAYVLGFTMMETIIISLCTVFGATPIVVKLLADKDELSTLPGKIDVGVLVIQDIYLVFILTLMGTGNLTDPASVATTIGTILVMAGVIGGIAYAASRFVLPPLFKTIANNPHAFFIHGLAWCFLLISLSDYLGLSIEIGAFIAGLSLGQLPYNNEFKERIRPLTDFFMMIFFVSIGLSLNSEALLTYWKEALIASAIMMPGNLAIMFYLIDREKFTPETSFIGGLNLTQVSEFSLVVGAVAVSQGYVGSEIIGYLSLMALITMSLSVYIITYNRQIYERFEHLLERFSSSDKNDVEVNSLENHAVVVGYDEMAKQAIHALEKYYDTIVVVDRDASNVEELSKSPYEYIYGDFKHGEIRKAANLDKAEFLISFSPEEEVNKKLIEDSVDATVFVKANRRDVAAELYDMGAHYVILKNVMSSEKLSKYIKRYLIDPKIFNKEVSSFRNLINWSDRDV